MSEGLRHYVRAVYGLDHVLRLVPADAWDRPSPCDGWSVRDVTGHAIGVVHNVAARTGMGELVDVFADDPAQLAGDDPYATWSEIRDRVLAALDQQGVLQRTVGSSLGEMPVEQFIANMCADAVIHTWDIARGAGVDERLDPGSVAYVDAIIRARDESINRAPRRFDAIVDTGAAADAQTRMLAYAGRAV
jgi:uncharacterized protein (TIGR03086 family)